MHIEWNSSLGLGFASPMPDEEVLNAFYSTIYRRVMTKKRGFDHYLGSPNYRAQTRSQVEWVRSVAPTSGTWLDVGAGFGLLLWTVNQMMPAWSLHAVEPDEETSAGLREFAKVHTDFPAFWKREAFGENLFDVVSVSHVLEHLIDPVECLNVLFHYLKPGGLLLIEVPNDSLTELLSSNRCSDMPHLWFFSFDGFIRIIEAAGFQVRRASTLGLKRPGSDESFFVRMRRAVARRIHGPLANLDDPTWYSEGIDRTDLRILARKPNIDEVVDTVVK